MKVSIRFSIHFQIHRSKAKPVNEIILVLWFQPTKQTEVSLMWYYYTSQETSLDNLCNTCCFFTFPLLTYKMFRSTVSLVWLASNSMQLKASLYHTPIKNKYTCCTKLKANSISSCSLEAKTIHDHRTALKFDPPCSRMKRWLCITTKYCRLT